MPPFKDRAQYVANLCPAPAAALGAALAAAAGGGPPIALTLMLGLTCLAIGLIMGVLVLGFFVTMKGRRVKHQPTETKPPDV